MSPRAREHTTKPPRRGGQKVVATDLKSLGTILNGSDAANDAASKLPEKLEVPETRNAPISEPSKRQSGKKLLADRALEAIEETKDFGSCLVCSTPIKGSFCGRWLIPEKDDRQVEVVVDRFTCSGVCEKEQEKKPRQYGEIKNKRKVTHF